MKRIVLFLLVGCDLLDDGASSDPPPVPNPITVGETCNSIGRAYCRRVADCQLATEEWCLGQLAVQCCVGAECSRVDFRFTAAELDTCVAAVLRESCFDAEAGTFPSVCGI